MFERSFKDKSNYYKKVKILNQFKTPFPLIFFEDNFTFGLDWSNVFKGWQHFKAVFLNSLTCFYFGSYSIEYT